MAPCCRSVPQAWWMKTPSNSFTRSSSPREVSPRPGPPGSSQSPGCGPSGSSADGGCPFHGEETLTSITFRRPGAASVLSEGEDSGPGHSGNTGRGAPWGGAQAARQTQHMLALALALPRCHHLRTLPLQCLRCRREWGHPL